MFQFYFKMIKSSNSLRTQSQGCLSLNTPPTAFFPLHLQNEAIRGFALVIVVAVKWQLRLLGFAWRYHPPDLDLPSPKKWGVLFA